MYACMYIYIYIYQMALGLFENEISDGMRNSLCEMERALKGTSFLGYRSRGHKIFL